MTRLAGVLVAAAFELIVLAQPKPGTRLSLNQYSYTVRTLVQTQAAATAQFQEGAKQAMAARGVPVRVALLENAYHVYAVQLESLAGKYRKLAPPRELVKLNALYAEGNATLAQLLRKLIPPLRRQDRKAMAPIEEQIRQFGPRFQRRVKSAVLDAGFDYARYEKDLTFVRRSKK